MHTKSIKRYWVRSIVRLVIFLFFLTLASYESFTADDPFQLWLTWYNGLMFALNITLIPVIAISLFVGGIIWCYKGFNAPPKTTLNATEGISRLTDVLLALLILTVLIIIGVTSSRTQTIFFALIISGLCMIVGFVDRYASKGF